MLKLLGLIISLLVITSTGRYLIPPKTQYALSYYYSMRRPNRQFDPLAVQVFTTASPPNSKCVPPTNTCSHDYECPPYHKCFADRLCGYKVCRKVATTNSAAETTTEYRKTNKITTELPCTDSWNPCDISKEKCEFDSQCPPCYTCHDDVNYGYKVCKHVSNITIISKPTSIFETTVTSTPEVITPESATVTSTPAISSDVISSEVITTESTIVTSAPLKTFGGTVSEVTTTGSMSFSSVPINSFNLTTSEITTTSVVTSVPTTTSEVTSLVTTSSTVTTAFSTVKIPELGESTVLVEALLNKIERSNEEENERNNDYNVRPLGSSIRRLDDDFLFDEEIVTSASLEFESEETAIYSFRNFDKMESQNPETVSKIPENITKPVSRFPENTTLGPRTTISQSVDEQFSGSGIGSGDEQVDYEEYILSTRTPLDDDFSFIEVTQESDSDPVLLSIANRTDRENNNMFDSDITKQLLADVTTTTVGNIMTTTTTEEIFTEVTNNVTFAAPKTTILESIKSVSFVINNTETEVVTNEPAKVGTTSSSTTEELLYKTPAITEQEGFREKSNDIKENEERFQEVNIITESTTNEKMKIDNLSTNGKVDEKSSLIDVLGILPDIKPDYYLSNKDYYVILDDYE